MISNVIRSFIINTATDAIIGVKFLGLGAALQTADDIDGGTSDWAEPIDPYSRDGYRYNSEHGNWYEAPPQPDYGQWDWQAPASPSKNAARVGRNNQRALRRI